MNEVGCLLGTEKEASKGEILEGRSIVGKKKWQRKGNRKVEKETKIPSIGRHEC